MRSLTVLERGMIERSMAYKRGGVEREEGRKESDECCQLVWRLFIYFIYSI